MKLRDAFLAVGLAACSPSPDEASVQDLHEATPVVEQVEAAPTPEQITLGGATFLIGPESGFTPEERVEVVKKMQAAHARLSAELGEDVMTLLEPANMPVQKKVCQGCPNGRVVWTTGKIEFDEGFKPHWGEEDFQGVALELSELDEDTIAHEFLHFFAQHSIFWSEAFYEGVVHGTTLHLYPNPKLDGPRQNALDLVRNRCGKLLFDQGWDYSQADTALHGGVQDVHARNLLHAHFMVNWGDFVNQHPDFPKKFFKQILEGRRQGKVDFSKAELFEIAVEAEPEFAAWFENEGSSTQDIEPGRHSFVLPLDTETLLVVRLGFNQSIVQEDQYRPAVAGRLSGPVPELVLPDGRVAAQLTTTGAISILPIKGLSKLPAWQVQIDGKPMPVMHPWTCELHDSFPPR
jgi:hypothetical protein